MNNNFSLQIAQSLVESQEQFPIDFDSAWQWLEYSRKDHGKRAFEKYGFIENVDFEVFPISGENYLGGRPSHLIKLSVDCFKTWAMMSQTEKGKQVRLYFLECEKIAKQSTITTPKIPQTYAEALLEAGRLALENEKLLKEAEENRPKVEFAEAVSFSEDSLEFGEYAKIIGTGRNRLMQKLRELNILMKNSTIPYQRYCDAGYFEVSQEITANGKLIPFALITGKGQMWLYQKLKEAKLIVPKTLTSLQPSLRLEY